MVEVTEATVYLLLQLVLVFKCCSLSRLDCIQSYDDADATHCDTWQGNSLIAKSQLNWKLRECLPITLIGTVWASTMVIFVPVIASAIVASRISVQGTANL